MQNFASQATINADCHQGLLANANHDEHGDAEGGRARDETETAASHEEETGETDDAPMTIDAHVSLAQTPCTPYFLLLV